MDFSNNPFGKFVSEKPRVIALSITELLLLCKTFTVRKIFQKRPIMHIKVAKQGKMDLEIRSKMRKTDKIPIIP
jgi:hypothetical protein